jgi:nucleoside phosphorylase
MPPLTNKEYTVGWICALPLEMAAATAMLDEEHGKPTRQDPNDKNNYTLGRVGQHNIIIACLPGGVYGTISAATVAIQMLSSFGSIKFGLMIGIGGGVPSSVHDIRLGDVVVSKPKGTLSGVLQYDFGKTVEQGQIIPVGSLNKPPQVLLTAIASLEAAHLKRENNISRYISEMLLRNPQMQQKFAYQGVKNDQLYEAYYQHVGGSTCENCDSSKLVTRPMRDKLDPVVFYGTIGSGNQVMKDGVTRDNLARQHDVLCFEMEAAGLMDNFPCLVIRGICDYADSHKNKRWQEYAAATAAAYAKELLYTIPISDIEQTNHPTILTGQLIPQRIFTS